MVQVGLPIYSTVWQIDHFYCDSKRQQTCREQIFMLINIQKLPYYIYY